MNCPLCLTELDELGDSLYHCPSCDRLYELHNYLRGWAWCPVCLEPLELRAMPGAGEKHWHCLNCEIEWDTSVLIEYQAKGVLT